MLDNHWLEMLANHMRKHLKHWWGERRECKVILKALDHSVIEHSGFFIHLFYFFFSGWLPKSRATTNGWKIDLGLISISKRGTQRRGDWD